MHCAIYTEYISLPESNLQKACFRNRCSAFLQVHFIDQWCTPSRYFFKACFAVYCKTCFKNYTLNTFWIYSKSVQCIILSEWGWQVFSIYFKEWITRCWQRWTEKNIFRGFSTFWLFSRTNYTPCSPDFPPNCLQIFYKERIRTALFFIVQTGKF